MTEYVYAIESGERAIKFGRGCNPESRLSTMQTGNPDRLVLMSYQECFSVEHARDQEKLIHAFLRPYRLHGEWFKMAPTTLMVANCLGTPYFTDVLVSEFDHMVESENSQEDRLTLINRWVDYWVTDFTWDTGRIDDGGLSWCSSFPGFTTDVYYPDGKIDHKCLYTDDYRNKRHQRVMNRGLSYGVDLIY